MAACPTYAEIRRDRLAKRRAEAVAALLSAEGIAKAAGGRLVVFGSLVEGEFNEGSDVDVALLGLPAGPDIAVAAEVDTAISLAGFTADVTPERFLPPSLRERIERNGREPGALG
jgi:predicted nucleotidyltransferase